MEAVVRWCLKNKSVVLLAAVILIASGVYATTRLNQELLPEIEFPIVTVSTPVPGAGTDLVEEQVTQPVEAAVDDVEGIESIQSTSSAGFSVILIEFSLDTDTKEAEADLNSALDGITLPQQAEEPEVQTQSASEFPIMNVSLSAEEGELSNLTNYARDEAVPLIEDVEGVASADLVGGAERRIEVELDPRRLEETGLSADAVVGAISGAAGVNTPVGEVEIDGLSSPMRTTSGLADAEALAELPVGVAGASRCVHRGRPGRGCGERAGRGDGKCSAGGSRECGSRAGSARRRGGGAGGLFGHLGRLEDQRRAEPRHQHHQGARRQHRRGGRRGERSARGRPRRPRRGPGARAVQFRRRRRGVRERAGGQGAHRRCSGDPHHLPVPGLVARHARDGGLSADLDPGRFALLVGR